jgi:hypothetical protein
MTRQRWLWFFLTGTALVGLLMIGCAPGDPAVTATPTRTRVVLALATNTPVPTPTFQPSVTSTPSPLPSLTSVPASPSPLAPAATPAPTDTPPVPSHTPLPLPPTSTATPAATAPPPSPRPPTATPTTSSQPPLPPQQGGEWDMEAGFVPGSSPLGEDCPGWAVAQGWQAFLAPGTPASSCFNENKNPTNVHSGQRSQEITFDFISAEAGIFKHAQTIPGHRYQIEAWGKHVRSQSPVELSLGVDLSGGEDWQAASVGWYPWNETGEDVWVYTQVTVRATGETLTVFLKGHHPFAAQGGATLFDDVRVVDSGQ